MSRSKYNARPTYVGNLRFDSALEARRWRELCLMERAGYITQLRRQVRIPLHAGNPPHIVGHYIADFTYQENGEAVVEDAKGHQTPVSKWKLKHYAIEYGHQVRIHHAPKRRKR